MGGTAAERVEPASRIRYSSSVEQTSAAQDGFPEDMIDAPDNRLRIPTLKHWEINGWYSIPNKEFGWLSPRDYLQGKDWDERLRIGKLALIKFGVLKP